MTVHKIDVYQVSVPFRSVVSWASGVRSGTTRLIVKVTAHDGRVRIGGEEWSARAYDESLVIPVGTTVDVIQIEGATALVYPRE